MTPLKFRAWHKSEKNMYDVYHLAVPMHDSGAIKLAKNTRDYSQNEWESIGDVEVMQSTGLRDRSGKEIFEGDIVRDEKRMEDFQIREVIWSETLAMFLVRTPRYSEELGEIAGRIEIIGNIYESPEILHD